MTSGFPMDDYTFSPIGVVHSANRYKFEAARQGVFSSNTGEIELFPGFGYELALEELSGFERIWVLFVFHLNKNWNPKVSPPLVGDKQRIGVFATRSPHRPNPIGMSCVELEKIDGLVVHVRNHDFLDGTPVLDLKPYIPRADSFPDSKAGWRDQVQDAEYPVDFTPEVREKMAFLYEISGLDLLNFCQVQLAHDPASDKRKRVDALSGGEYAVGCRTWKAGYRIEKSGVVVFDLRSNYTPDELKEGAPDIYGDKAFHRRFREVYG